MGVFCRDGPRERYESSRVRLARRALPNLFVPETFCQPKVLCKDTLR